MKYILAFLLLSASYCPAQRVVINPGFEVGEWVQSGEFFSNKEPVTKVELFSNGKRYVLQYFDGHCIEKILDARKYIMWTKLPGYCQTNDFTRSICAEKKRNELLLKSYRIVIIKNLYDSVYTDIYCEKIRVITTK